MPADTWPMLVAAGYLRRGWSVERVAAHCRLTVAAVRAIEDRLVEAEIQRVEAGR